MLYVETPTNPTMIITDLAAAAALANEQKLTLVVDNTFLSPYFQKPIALGAHIVVHSMTKYLNGHSDCTGGAVVLTRKEDADKIYFLQRSTGAGLAPMDCFLVSRGIKTLAVRMKQHEDKRYGGRQVSRGASESEARSLSWLDIAPSTRDGEETADRIRRDAFL